MPTPSHGQQIVSTEPIVATHLRLNADPDDIGHLVCCRDPSWRTAFCGIDSDTINLAVTTVCTMCIEQAEAMRPGFLAELGTNCPVDGHPCPDEHETDLRIAQETGPSARQ
ncbi:hypothetical protein GCM10009664_37190 [Kitasatospora gansuensis]